MSGVLVAASREVLYTAISQMSYVYDSYYGDRVVEVNEALEDVLKVVRVIDRNAVQALVDQFDDDMAEGYCDCGNYRNNTDELVRRIMALLGSPE